ncbi:hypothetical protein UA08_01278 [Talaromyces atroroseus]|uniref:FAD-binding PCMH-type domain-containing protein n=1 Tax=Talaromyces atroroseus TaxID=1441469 RepID=A0A1Q5QAX5_TALAT|nr:hypothetical protein UA08_01278 [Talaromyces atroroseus]OKL63070.1 hypothetical protein UA08_01278 [Talaromyces atroroseus]
MIALKTSLSAAFLSIVALNSSGALAYRWFNWQFDITCEATGFFVPANESELVSFVKSQYPRKTLLKPVVTFGGGWDLVDLIPTLHDHGLQVQNLGSEKVQNYIGASTTGTHDTGKQNQNLATQIIGLRVLDSQGNIHVIDKDNNLEAFRVAVGALGIITEVTIQAEPVSYLKRTNKVVEGPSNITELYQTIADIGAKYEQININGPNLVWNSSTQQLVPSTNLTLVYWEPTNHTGPANCSVDFCSNDCGICNRDYTCYDYKMNSIATTPAGICYRGFMGQFEHFFPVENLAEAGTDYFNYAISQSDRLAPYQGIKDILAAQGMSRYESDDVTVITRFVKGDDTWLSPVNTYNLQPNASGVFATLEYSWVPSYNNFTLQWFYQDLASEFIPQFGDKYNVRPHWNKMLFNNDTYASTIYPKINDWLEIQEQMDPQCQFVNPFLVDRLGIDRCRSLFE